MARIKTLLIIPSEGLKPGFLFDHIMARVLLALSVGQDVTIQHAPPEWLNTIDLESADIKPKKMPQ